MIVIDKHFPITLHIDGEIAESGIILIFSPLVKVVSVNSIAI